MAYIYQNYRDAVKTTGNISAEFGWVIKRKFSIDVVLGFCPFWTAYYDALTNKKAYNSFGLTTYVVPEARMSWVNKPSFRLLSSIGLGVGLNIGKEYKTAAIPIIQMDVIGIEFGRDFYGTAKLGIGTEFTGMKLGLGYRF